MPAGRKKSACMSEVGFIHLAEGDPTTDIGCDPALEHKILNKIEALKERLVLWTRRLDESVYLNNSQFYIMLQCFIQFSLIPCVPVGKRSVLSSIFRIEAWYEQESFQASNMMEYTVQFLLMELESVGNIRLEEGCPTDPW